MQTEAYYLGTNFSDGKFFKPPCSPGAFDTFTSHFCLRGQIFNTEKSIRRIGNNAAEESTGREEGRARGREGEQGGRVEDRERRRSGGMEEGR